jgi:serine/threonine-protein kinase HipA
MNPDIKYCPSLLYPGFSTYSPRAQALLFGRRGRKVFHILPFGPPGKNADLTRTYNEKRKRISISGVQEKYSMAQNKNDLLLTGNRGSHILKPVPAERLELVSDMPANEHVSMQIAAQAFGIRTAANGMIFFDDGSPAYITRRFDYKSDGSKYQLEDFATLLGKSPEKEGDDFKYNASYLDIAVLIQRYVAAAPVALVQFFQLVVCNYIIANGDAHLKNFSLIESDQGDYLLAPAYDLLCTALHTDDTILALHEGLYPGDHKEDSFVKSGSYTKTSFLIFAEKTGVRPDIASGIIDEIMNSVVKAVELVEKSFLSAEGKKKYIGILGDRWRAMKRR